MTPRVWRLGGGALLLLGALACAGRSVPPRQEPIAPSPAVFPVPRVIAVDVAPFPSIEAALAAADTMDWRNDSVRASSITLAHAARELQQHLGQAGIDADIDVLDSGEGSAIVLKVVEGTLVPDVGEAIDHAALGVQGYAITPSAGRVLVSGATRVGVLYGTYRLLQELGFHWVDPGETIVPALDGTAPLEWPTLREVPSVERRGFWIFGEQQLSDEHALWMARNRLNLGGRPRTTLGAMLGLQRWEGDHEVLQQEFSQPGLFEQHPDWFALVDGVRRRIEPTGAYFNPAFGNPEVAAYFADRVIERLEGGDLADVDLLNVWPVDDRFNAFDQSSTALALGNETDNLLFFYSGLANALRDAWLDGRLSRPVTVVGISYFRTMMPPTNRDVVAALEGADYLHLFYPIERDWAGPVDERLVDRDRNREMLQDLESWRALADLSYGVVEYYNVSTFGAVALTNAPYLEHDHRVLTAGRTALFAYMHPQRDNPGPRSLTNALLAGLSWQTLDGRPVVDGETITARWFSARFGDRASRWRAVHEQMARSVENAQQLFGTDSLMWVLFQEQIWAEPFYQRAEANAFVPRYRAGGVQELPGGYSARPVVRASFPGLDASIAEQEEATRLWQDALSGPLDPAVRARMLEDVEWFAATASRYRLTAAACDWQLAGDDEGLREAARARTETELSLLQTTAVLHDTISPVEQDMFLAWHRNMLGAP